MEPNFPSRAASNNDTQSKQNHFLSLRKAKRNTIYLTIKQLKKRIFNNLVNFLWEKGV